MLVRDRVQLVGGSLPLKGLLLTHAQGEVRMTKTLGVLVPALSILGHCTLPKVEEV